MECKNDLNFDAVMEGCIDEYLSEVMRRYCEKIPTYTEAKTRKREMVNSHRALLDFIDRGIPSALTMEECQCLLEIVKVEMETLWCENRACYYRGLIDGIKLKESFE